MKRFVLFLAVVVSLALAACSGDNKHNPNAQGSAKYVGHFVDEFGNKFVLNEDYTGTIQFDRNDKVDSIRWDDGENHDRPYATIQWNGDPTYYFLRDGNMYRHQEDMEFGRCAIKISYSD